MEPADLAIVNARVCGEGGRECGDGALAVRGERICAVGCAADVSGLIGPHTRVINAGGGSVTPGFNDAHMHALGGGRVLRALPLRESADEADFAQRIGRYARENPGTEWITGGQWDHERWPGGRRPTRTLLDSACSERPVLLRRIDGHIAVANSAALALAGITRETPDPSDGTIERNADGEPTGILCDGAIGLVGRHVPSPSLDDDRESMLAALRHANRLGVTSIQTSVSDRHIPLLREMRENRTLTCRCSLWLSPRPAAQFAPARDALGGDDAYLRCGTVKCFADGSFGAGTALLFEPYEDAPETAGVAVAGEDELVQILSAAEAQGLQFAVHAIGDRAAHHCLNALERVRDANGRLAPRHRIEHAQLLRPRDRARFRELGVIASVQPSHCTDDMRWLPKRIGARTAFAYPFASLLREGVPVASGTDWPVESLDPLLTLHAAVTREQDGGGPPGGWQPEEKVSLSDALAAYTRGSAYAERQEHDKGTLAVGSLADVVVFSHDLFALPPSELMTASVTHTVVGGRVMWEEEC